MVIKQQKNGFLENNMIATFWVTTNTHLAFTYMNRTESVRLLLTTNTKTKYKKHN